MEVRITFSEAALQDMIEIREWYAEQGVPEIGQRLVAEIVGHVEVLGDHPDLGRIVPEFSQVAIRELIHPPFRIVYRRDSMDVRVIRVWRSERLLRLPSTGEQEE
jgi:plasmid stabilization system protein ParE